MLPQHESKKKLLDATLRVVRTRGYTATRIEDVCTEAGVTKGSFFHHFESKEELALAAAAHWDANVSQLFASAPYHDAADPLDRLIAYVDFRRLFWWVTCPTLPVLPAPSFRRPTAP